MKLFLKGKKWVKKFLLKQKKLQARPLKALKTLIKDPIGGQFEALKNLGQSNALRAGIVLVVIFSISCFLLGHSIVSELHALAQTFGGNIQVVTGAYFKLLLFSLIPPCICFCMLFSDNETNKQRKRRNFNMYIYNWSIYNPFGSFIFLYKIVWIR